MLDQGTIVNFSQIGLNQIVSFMSHISLARKYRSSSNSLQAYDEKQAKSSCMYICGLITRRPQTKTRRHRPPPPRRRR